MKANLQYLEQGAHHLGKALAAFAIIALIGWIGYLLQDGLRTETAYRWVGIDIQLQAWVMVLSLIMIKKRNLTLSVWGWAALGSVFLTMGDPLANYLHPFLIEHQAYPSWWGRGNQPDQSSQYAKLLLWTLLLVINLGWVCLKSKRTLGRIFALLISGSVAVTSLLFHVAIIKQSTEFQTRQMQAAEVFIKQADQKGFELFCQQTGALCITESTQEKMLAVLDKSNWPSYALPQTKKTLLDLESAYEGNVVQWRETEPTNNFNRLPTHLIAAVKLKDSWRLWSDSQGQRRALQLGEAIYALLALSAHIFWIVGIGSLALWHESRLSKRRLQGQVKI